MGFDKVPFRLSVALFTGVESNVHVGSIVQFVVFQTATVVGIDGLGSDKR